MIPALTAGAAVVLLAARRPPAPGPRPWGIGLAWAVLGAGVMISPIVTVAVATAALVAGAVTVAAEWRHERLEPTALAAGLEEVARSLRGGASPRQALGEAAAALAESPVGRDLARLATQAERGIPLPMVLRGWTRRRPEVPEVRTAGAALAFAVETGASAAQAVDDVADTVRTHAELRSEVRALASQARASAALLAGLPIGFTVIAGAADPSSVSFLFGSTAGRVCLVSGLVLEVVGWWWMQRIVAGALS